MAFTCSCTFGIRVWPPTKMTSSISDEDTPASFIATWHGPIVRVISSSTKDSSLERVSFKLRCLGPLASAVTYGRLISVCCEEESSILAFSAASLRRCKASTSLLRSTPCSFLNSAIIQSIMRWSKSSPPKKVSPLVDSTSNCFSPSTFAISIMETSKVPPPRSYTAILRSTLSCLSRPNAKAAAVGSLMILFTSRPAIRPASLVA